MLLLVLNEVSVCFPAGLWHRSMIQLPKDADGILARKDFILTNIRQMTDLRQQKHRHADTNDSTHAIQSLIGSEMENCS